MKNFTDTGSPFSMGAMGASAPTVFESVGASTLSRISNICHKNCVKNVMNLAIPWRKDMSSTHSLEFPKKPCDNQSGKNFSNLLTFVKPMLLHPCGLCLGSNLARLI